VKSSWYALCAPQGDCASTDFFSLLSSRRSEPQATRFPFPAGRGREGKGETRNVCRQKKRTAALFSTAALAAPRERQRTNRCRDRQPMDSIKQPRPKVKGNFRTLFENLYFWAGCFTMGSLLPGRAAPRATPLKPLLLHKNAQRATRKNNAAYAALLDLPEWCPGLQAVARLGVRNAQTETDGRPGHHATQSRTPPPPGKPPGNPLPLPGGKGTGGEGEEAAPGRPERQQEKAAPMQPGYCPPQPRLILAGSGGGQTPEHDSPRPARRRLRGTFAALLQAGTTDHHKGQHPRKSLRLEPAKHNRLLTKKRRHRPPGKGARFFCGCWPGTGEKGAPKKAFLGTMPHHERGCALLAQRCCTDFTLSVVRLLSIFCALPAMRST